MREVGDRNSEAVEEYLEAIYSLIVAEVPVIGARIAHLLGVTAPTVTGMLHRMVAAGLITVDERREVQLTESGRLAAEATVRRHRLSERLLTDLLGLEWHKSHQEACRFEHAISPEVEKRLSAALGDPTTCPHGNPIPGIPNPRETLGCVALSEIGAGGRATVERIQADAEREPSLLAYLESHGLSPGSLVEVEGIAPWGGTINLLVDGRQVSLGLEWAARLMVRSEV